MQIEITYIFDFMGIRLSMPAGRSPDNLPVGHLTMLALRWWRPEIFLDGPPDPSLRNAYNNYVFSGHTDYENYKALSQLT